MFRTLGHKNSSILDGGLPRWVDAGLPIETATPSQPKATVYDTPKIEDNSIRSKGFHSDGHTLCSHPLAAGYETNRG